MSSGFGHLDTLESESVHIFREVAGEFERPVILFSGGKDSVVMLHLALKAFAPAPTPFPLLHVDTGHNFPEVIEYRDRAVAKHGLRLHVASVQDYIDRGVLRERADGTRNPLQTLPLTEKIQSEKFDAVLPILQPVLDVTRPDAGFYLWPRVPVDEVEFARGLIARENVTVLPGSYLARDAHGLNPGTRRVRVALVPPLVQCIEAAHRIRSFVESLQ